MDINLQIKEIKNLLKPSDIEFFLSATIGINQFKRSRMKIAAAMQLLNNHQLFKGYILEFYLKDSSGKFRCTDIQGVDSKIKNRYQNMKLVYKTTKAVKYFRSSDFSQESIGRRRFIEEAGIKTSFYFPVANYGTLVLSNSVEDMERYKTDFVYLYIKYIVAPAVELAIDNEKNFGWAIRDSLTGLYNKGYFLLQLEREAGQLRAGKTISLILIDIDHFKVYNDKNGHPAGDKLLRLIPKIFLSVVRRYDIVARYGGEEFAIILPGADAEVAEKRAEKIRLIVESFKFSRMNSMPDGKITVSIGVGNIPLNATTYKELLLNTDKALYASKETGRNRVTVYNKLAG